MDGIPLGSSYTWASARAAGVTRRQIERDGHRIGQGLYLSQAVEPTLLERCRAWSRLLPAEASFGGATAAVLRGAPLAEPSRPTVVLPPHLVVPARRELVRLVRTLGPEDVGDHAGIRVTSGPQTFLDLAAALPPHELVAVGDALMRGGHLDAVGLVRRLVRADRVRGVVRARACAPLLNGLAQSRPESHLRYWLSTSTLPPPEVQVPVRDRRGRVVAHGDLGYSRWKVLLEYEGRQHAERDQFRRDVDRYSLMAIDGWLLLRFADHHLGGPFAVVERTRRALLSRGWRPDPC
ncbi:hypothetical protein [Modestobacter versicolor]|uniref:DUF559 domain-containing protein n=1 Tax=Modestobacter versicolor TaxID=429133 RepID=A0A323VBH4_9ACTN|nr:hypothetical protein [Modestobacter versicolor]MBB3675508.1 hypothetical protein [Modestobacter versicolor]PZA22184.1 hypothetical protein DMO24_06345 [Modestobacter versicolor]